jgi:hypothetical protein
LLDGLDEVEDVCLHVILRQLVDVQQRTSCGIIMASRVDSDFAKSSFMKLERLEITAHAADIRYYVYQACRGPIAKDFTGSDPGQVTKIGQAVIAGSCGS